MLRYANSSLKEHYEMLSSDGFYKTGDLFRVVDGRDFYHCARVEECMYIDGTVVYPGQIEELVLQHDAVADVAVIRGHEDKPLACVVLKDPTMTTGSVASTKENILQFIISRVRHSAIPLARTLVLITTLGFCREASQRGCLCGQGTESAEVCS